MSIFWWGSHWICSATDSLTILIHKDEKCLLQFISSEFYGFHCGNLSLPRLSLFLEFLLLWLLQIGLRSCFISQQFITGEQKSHWLRNATAVSYCSAAFINSSRLLTEPWLFLCKESYHLHTPTIWFHPCLFVCLSCFLSNCSGWNFYHHIMEEKWATTRSPCSRAEGSAFHFSTQGDVACGLSYVAFIMLRHDPSITNLLWVFGLSTRVILASLYKF